MRAVRTIAINLLLALAASLLLLSGALAHAGLVSSDPADGSVLAAAPEALTLSFTEPVTPLVFTLVTPAGERHDLDGASATDQQVTQALPDGLARGTHLLSWRVVSADGHPVAGSLVFSIGEPGTRPVVTAGPDILLATAIWTIRAGLYAALFLGVGAAVFGLVVAPLPGPLRRFSQWLSLAGLLLAPLALGLQGLDALGVGFGRLLSAAPWSTALSTSYGATVITALVGFAATLAAARLGPGRRQAALVLLAWTAAALAPVLSGHAGTAAPVWLSRPAVFLHIAGLLFWIGALVPLGWLLRTAGTAALERFSRLIPLAVAPVIASGIALAALQMGPPGAAWLSAYGVLLGAKLVLLAVLFGLALWNRAVLTGPVLAGTDPARRRLRRSIVAELLLVLAIFGIVAGWRFTPPPRVVAEIAAQPARLHLHGEAAMADLTFTPGRAGATLLRIWLTDAGFAAISPRSVALSLSNPALGIERLKRSAEPAADGFWEAPLLLPAGGTWTVELDLRIDSFTLVKLTGQVDLNP